jgi:hypothetical protein
MANSTTIVIESITLLTGDGRSDKLELHCQDLPSGVWPYAGNAALTLEIAADRGKDYCQKHFPNMGITIIEL